LFKKGGGSLAEKFTRAAVIFFHSTLHQHAAAGFKSFAARLSAKRPRLRLQAFYSIKVRALFAFVKQGTKPPRIFFKLRRG